MKKKKRIKDFDEFMAKTFIVCDCGYNNKKENVKMYGTCLGCGKILDQKIFFEKKLKLELKKTNKKYGVIE